MNDLFERRFELAVWIDDELRLGSGRILRRNVFPEREMSRRGERDARIFVRRYDVQDGIIRRVEAEPTSHLPAAIPMFGNEPVRIADLFKRCGQFSHSCVHCFLAAVCVELKVQKERRPFSVKGLLVPESLDLETSRTSTGGAKKKTKDDDFYLLAIHILRITGVEKVSSKEKRSSSQVNEREMNACLPCVELLFFPRLRHQRSYSGLGLFDLLDE